MRREGPSRGCWKTAYSTGASARDRRASASAIRSVVATAYTVDGDRTDRLSAGWSGCGRVDMAGFRSGSGLLAGVVVAAPTGGSVRRRRRVGVLEELDSAGAVLGL